MLGVGKFWHICGKLQGICQIFLLKISQKVAMQWHLCVKHKCYVLLTEAYSFGFCSGLIGLVKLKQLISYS